MSMYLCKYLTSAHSKFYAKLPLPAIRTQLRCATKEATVNQNSPTTVPQLYRWSLIQWYEFPSVSGRQAIQELKKQKGRSLSRWRKTDSMRRVSTLNPSTSSIHRHPQEIHTTLASPSSKSSTSHSTPPYVTVST